MALIRVSVWERSQNKYIIDVLICQEVFFDFCALDLSVLQHRWPEWGGEAEIWAGHINVEGASLGLRGLQAVERVGEKQSSRVPQGALVMTRVSDLPAIGQAQRVDSRGPAAREKRRART